MQDSPKQEVECTTEDAAAVITAKQEAQEACHKVRTRLRHMTKGCSAQQPSHCNTN